MPKQPKQFHATLDRNGTEDEFTIRTPKGRAMAAIWFWESQVAGTRRAKQDALRIVNSLNLIRRVKKRIGAKADLQAFLMIDSVPHLFAALEKCEAALDDIFTRYQQDGDQPSESEKLAKEEAHRALCIARGDIPF